MNLGQIFSEIDPQKYHRDFDRTKNSRWRRKYTFLRMHINRTIQSAYIILNHPLIWPCVIRGFVSAVRGKSSLLRSLELAVTYRCNSRCEQCSCRLQFDSQKEKTQKLSLKEFQNVVDQAVELGAFQFAINGGEPMLEEEMVYDLTMYIKKHHGCYVHLCTNGTLLTKAKLEKLKECGLDSIEMGFDSAFEVDHDKNRIKGSYQKILDNIRFCKRLGIRVILNTILTNEKVKTDDIIYTVYIAKKLGCLLQITPCCLTGAFQNRMDIMLTEESKLYFYWLLGLSWNNRSDLYSSLTSIKCPAAREKIGLQPYGDVVSCPLIQIRYGNVREKSLKEIQLEMLKNPYYNLKKCQDCLPAMNEEFIRKYLVNQ
ncbi:MAG: radical SAM protein [Nitrospirota bacterium]